VTTTAIPATTTTQAPAPTTSAPPVQAPVPAPPTTPYVAPYVPPAPPPAVGASPGLTSPAGNLYRAGEFCPKADLGVTTTGSDGRITCQALNGYDRWVLG
jgi:hypothetical protein